MDASIKEAGYENIYVDCPCCKKENIYNRRNDLCTIEAIGRKNNIKCQFCGAIFSIIGDTVKSSKFRWFLDEIQILKERKNYMLYILFLCQACEAFFEQAIINKKVDRTSKIRDREGFVDIKKYIIEFDKLNRSSIFNLCGSGSKTIFEKAAFFDLREVFLHEFSQIDEQRTIDALNIVKNTDIHEIRNKVIHKNAYRPKICEIEKYDSLITALFVLGYRFDVMDSINILNTT